MFKVDFMYFTILMYKRKYFKSIVFHLTFITKKIMHCCGEDIFLTSLFKDYWIAADVIPYSHIRVVGY